MAAMTPKLESFRRIVVKIGSSLLVDGERGALREAWLAALVEDIGGLAKGAPMCWSSPRAPSRSGAAS